jgi:uncharacterized protein (DUF3084 family)
MQSTEYDATTSEAEFFSSTQVSIEQRIQSLQNRLDAVTTLGNQLAEQEQKFGDYQSEIFSLREQLSSNKALIDAQTREIAHRAEELEQEKRKRLALEKQLVGSETLVAHLKHSLTNLRKAASLEVGRIVLAFLTAGGQSSFRFGQKRHSIKMLRRTGVLDEVWYLSSNKDVAQAGLDPIKHYIQNGASEGREHAPIFSDYNS